MAKRRTYGDRCGIARALDVVGDRWALLVVRELLLGPKRFTDLRAGLPRVTPDVLAQRLRDLEADGVLLHRKLPRPASARVYELTPRGQELEPVILELGRWGSAEPFPDGELGADAFVLALKTVFDSARRNGDAHVELRMGEDRYDARLLGDRFDVARGAAEDPQATIDGDPATLAEVTWHGRSLDALEIAGDKRAAKRFLQAFAVPAGS
jgi:DNA-binding HxlR family transcriptional regulator